MIKFAMIYLIKYSILSASFMGNLQNPHVLYCRPTYSYRPVASQPGGGGGGGGGSELGWAEHQAHPPPPPLDIVRVTSSI